MDSLTAAEIEARHAALTQVLLEHPDAPVAALNATGMFVAMPSSFADRRRSPAQRRAGVRRGRAPRGRRVPGRAAAVPDSNEALKIAGRMAALLSQEVNLPGGLVNLSSSMGVAWSKTPGLLADGFVGQADTAMYQSKGEGRGLPVLAGSGSPTVPIEDRRNGRALRLA